MMCGAVAWCFAFTVVFVLEWVLVANPSSETYQFWFPSGRGYIASTFSNLSHRHSSVQGRIFSSVGLVSAISIQTSWYTELLRNVCTHQQRMILPFGMDVRWTWFRLVAPTMGILLITGVNTVPRLAWMHSPGKSLLAGVVVNSFGCWTIFVSYILSELHCLGYCEFLTLKCSDHGSLPDLCDTERRYRLWSVLAGGLCGVLFVVAQVVLWLLQRGCPGLGLSGLHGLLKVHCDEWAQVGQYVGLDATTQRWGLVAPDYDGRKVQIVDDPEVINTASGIIVYVKAFSLCFEFLGMVMYCLNVVAIWYYCEERHFPRKYLYVEDLDDAIEWFETTLPEAWEPPAALETLETADRRHSRDVLEPSSAVEAS
ncbi:unnamed protein product [Prorocentrum cordatum]|uniref:Uncharacterized protein n=1 Tax=Prorocentrum cordatum TaxID=2364126 RepID=A0ABN9RIK8_9DINO|nr:unnamed protein product [Polarella glacialis]